MHQEFSHPNPDSKKVGTLNKHVIIIILDSRYMHLSLDPHTAERLRVVVVVLVV